MFVAELDPKHRAGKHSGDAAFNFDMFFFHLNWYSDEPSATHSDMLQTGRGNEAKSEKAGSTRTPP